MNKSAIKTRSAFTIVEIVAAITILAAIAGSVLVVMNNCIMTVIDCRLQARAFEIARDNMETLLASSTVTDMTETGFDELNPAIEWQTTVQSFYEPVTSRMWVQAECSSSYIDSKNEKQTVEFVHWLTNLTKKQIKQILAQQQKELEFADQVQYEEYISSYQLNVLKYLVVNGLETADYEEFISQQRQDRFDWLDKYEYDQQTYEQFTDEQRQTERTILDDMGVVPEELDQWMTENAPDLFQATDSAADTDQTLDNSQDSSSSDSTTPDDTTDIDWDSIPPELVPIFKQLLEQ